MGALPVAFAVLLATGGGPASDLGGRPPAAPIPERVGVPLGESFSPLEVGLALGAAAGGVFLLTAGHLVLDAPSPPRLDAPAADSLEARLSRALHQEGSRRLLWRIPDRAGLALPALPLAFYALDTWFLLRHGAPRLLAVDGNPHHRLMGYVEAMGLTYLVTGIVKYSVGRPRPYMVEGNDHPDLRSRRSEDNLSFFSGHAAATFAMGAFVAEDLSRIVTRSGLGDTPFDRVMLGTVLPYGLGYGLPALTSLSRIVDQQHWPSDVLAGAACGILIARLTYARHFDGQGRPRRRRVMSGQLAPVAVPGSGGGLGLIYGDRF
jgi:membrane-associated phospholipid phosphatase